MTTTIETLRDQHQAVLACLDEVEARTPGPTAALQEFLGFLQTEMQEHLGLEEEALFPVLSRHPRLAEGPVVVMEAEHRELHALIAELAVALRTGSADQPLAIVRIIIALLRAHIDKEDHVLFPLAAHVLSVAELEEMEARAAARRRGTGRARVAMRGGR